MNWLVLLLSCALCGMTIAFGLTVRRLREQERSMEEAAHRIAEYILDQRKGGIECNEEGAMYHLFHEVNSLVTIADAHADSERQAKEFLRDTISDISHQLKTPIAALNIYNGILQQEAADTATVQEFTALSEQELDRIESLVQSLLKMARLDAGAITLEQSPENLSELLEHIREQYSFRAEQEGKEINLEGDEQASLLCDRTWLTEAIGNLVKNASGPYGTRRSYSGPVAAVPMPDADHGRGYGQRHPSGGPIPYLQAVLPQPVFQGHPGHRFGSAAGEINH